MKICLCGIIIGIINYELSYSATDYQQVVENQFTSQIILNNNSITDTNTFTLNNDVTINGSNNIIGKYDTSKYEIKDNILYEKDKVFCPNLEDVAIQNNNGKITFKSGSIISTKDGTGFQVIKDCTVDISNLIEFKDNSIVLKSNDTINSGFYNVNIKLFPDDFSKQQNYNEILIYLSNNDNFQNNNYPIFKNMKFYSTSPSTINLLITNSPVIVQSNEHNINEISYNTSKNIIKADSSSTISSYNIDNISKNILRLFYTEDDINKFGETPPLKVECTEEIKSSELHDFLNNPLSYIPDYSTNTTYGLDLFSFTFDNNTIDYSKIPNKMPKNIQFVINKRYKGNKDLILKSSNNKITIRQEFSDYYGILLLDQGIKRLNIINNNKNTNTYTIKMNKNVKVKTKGNIKLLLDNNRKVKFGGIKNTSGNLSIFPYKNNRLSLKIPVSNFSSVVNSNTQIDNNIRIILA